MDPGLIASTLDRLRLTLQSHEIDYDSESNDQLAIDYGSAQLKVLVRLTGESTVVHVSSCVLDHLTLDDETELRLLRSLNERNRTLPYGKFFFDRDVGQIHVEYEVLGDDLQDSEFMNALTTIARLADDHDDLLAEELGHGRRAADRV